MFFTDLAGTIHAIPLEAAMAANSEQIQKILDEAFAKFSHDFPDVARSIELMNITYADYLRLLSGQQNEIPSSVGSSLTPP